MTETPNNPTRPRAAFTLLELIVSMVVLSIILVGMGSVMILGAREIDHGASASVLARQRTEVIDGLTRDLRFATSFSERTDRAVTFTVPDRNGDGQPDTIRYAWEDTAGNPGGAGDPLVRRVNGGDPVILLENVDEFALTALTRVVLGDWIEVEDTTFNLLLVVGNPDSPTTSEQSRRDLFETWGYTVTLIDDNATQLEFDQATADAAVAYVCESVNGGSLGAKLTSAPIGVVNEDKEITNDLEIEEKDTRDYTHTLIKITDPSHSITSVFVSGDLAIASSGVKLLRPDGNLAPGARVLASKHDAASQATLVVVETGEMLYDGSSSPGRRVALPWGKDLDFSLINPSGQTLLRRAIDWAAGNEAISGGAMGYTTAFDTPVNNVRRIQIATQVTLPEDGTVTAISAFTGGSGQECRFAVYTDAAGEPDALIVESASFNTTDAYDWQSAPVAATLLPAGTYWLALSFASTEHRFFLESGGQLRYRDHWAEQSGFLSSWGGSDDSFTVKMSIHAAYTPN